jgi:DNA polymerase-1
MLSIEHAAGAAASGTVRVAPARVSRSLRTVHLLAASSASTLPSPASLHPAAAPGHSPAMPRIFLLDGTALAYRAHFALQRSGLTTPEGKPCGATYGFALTLRRILENEAPERIAVAFDPPGPTFRHREFPEYKATREKIPAELVDQLEWLRELVRAHGIPIFEVPGYEADDVIGTLARAAEQRGWDVLIVSGDKDMMQLVSSKVTLYNVFKPGVDVELQSFDAVQEKFGTTPEHVVDVLAIMGDHSDNVPGVHGIGEKGATQLIGEFGSVAELLANLDRVKGKVREKIERDREQLLKSLDLVTIRTDVPLDPGFDALPHYEPDPAAVGAFFRRLGFISLLKKVEDAAAANRARDYRTVRSRAELDGMAAELRRAGAFALDSETTSLFPLQAEIVGLSFSCSAGRAWYVPFNLEPPVVEGGPQAILAALEPLLCDRSLRRIGQNHKYDALVLRANGLRLPPADFDTLVASFTVAGATRRHSLDDLALTYFGLKKIPTSDLIGKGSKQITMAEVPIAKVAEYACEDAEVTWRLYEVLSKELAATQNEKLFYELEMPLVPVLTAMEERGIEIDVALLAQLGRELEAEIAHHAARFRELAGEEVNLNSPKALGELFFEKLRIHDAAGVKKPRKTKTGYATDFDTLTESYGEVEIVRHLLEHREVQKLKSTYVDALPRFVNPRTGRVHCSFSQTVAATGRLASSDPNLQNIPVRTDRGRKLRGAFVARKPDARGAWVLLTADYSQVELRILADLAGDERMRQAFAAGKDIHAATASAVFDVAEPLVTREMRSRAKAVNFGLLYGMGPARLARETGLTIVEARRFIERYFSSFPKVRGWRERVIAEAREKGYVTTLFGRKRPIADIGSSDSRLRVFAENAAVNTPVQGSAADIIKRAMIDLEARLESSTLAGRMLLQVHDELVLEVPEKELAETREIVRECMEGAAHLSVPLKVDFGHGRSWLDAH